MNRLVRRLEALFALAAFVFAQMAVSAYACARNDPAAAQAMVAMADMEGCDQSVNANLCDSHCAYGATNVQQSADAALPPFVAVLLPGSQLVDSAREEAFPPARRSLTVG